MKRTDINIELAIVSDFNTLSIYAIARKYGMYPSTVANILQRHSIDTSLGEKVSTPAVTVERMLHDYISGGLSSWDLADKYNVGLSTVRRVILRAGLKTGSNLHRPRIVYNDLLSSETALSYYWTGFLMADGSITNTRRLILRLAYKDYKHVLAYAAALGISSDYVTISKDDTYCGLVFTVGKRDAEVLARRGIVPRKTYNFVTPVIPLKYLRHYLRGWLDGDGSVDWNRFGVSVVGNNKAIAWFDRAMRNLGYTGGSRSYCYNDACYTQLRVTGRYDGYTLLHLLACEHDFKLERKWQGITQDYTFRGKLIAA